MSSCLESEKAIVELENKIQELRSFSEKNDIDLGREIYILMKKVEKMKRQIYKDPTPWQRVNLARYKDRPTSLDYIERLVDDFIEFHGDRYYGDDSAIVGGIGSFQGRAVTVKIGRAHV